MNLDFRSYASKLLLNRFLRWTVDLSECQNFLHIQQSAYTRDLTSCMTPSKSIVLDDAMLRTSWLASPLFVQPRDREFAASIMQCLPDTNLNLPEHAKQRNLNNAIDSMAKCNMIYV